MMDFLNLITTKSNDKIIELIIKQIEENDNRLLSYQEISQSVKNYDGFNYRIKYWRSLYLQYGYGVIKSIFDVQIIEIIRPQKLIIMKKQKQKNLDYCLKVEARLLYYY
ncbi:unnamed protein product [Paramecium sonneborni]|uniref:Uncharacterized protein n=1 Tax=Paramecium sonneborni TaxID=65129 RepID=A0A8S1L187_9CILI|nr:unnamed protein product [Paramecium sonneborni]